MGGGLIAGHHFDKLHMVFAHHNNIEGFMVQWCNPRTLQSKQSGGVGLILIMVPLLESHDKESQTQLALGYFCNPRAWHSGKTATSPVLQSIRNKEKICSVAFYNFIFSQ